MRRDKTENKKPILYVRYLLSHGGMHAQNISEEENEHIPGKFLVHVKNFFMLIILMGLIGLSTIGTIALVNDETRLLLINILKF